MYPYSLLLAVVFLAGINTSMVGQDGHYWTQQYGTKSMLLSGSVIGGVEDLGAVFYNPGRLGLIENPAFLLSAQVYEWQRLNISDGVGESADISKDRFGGVPSLVSGTFKLSFLEKHRFAYSVLQRQGINIDLSYKTERFGDLIDAFPGEEYLGASIRVGQKVKEQWASLTWSYPINTKMSVGLTSTFLTFEQGKSNAIELQALASNNSTAIYRYNRNFSMNNYGVLWKAGFAAALKNVDLGLTLTTPAINVTGKGEYQYEEFYSGIKEYPFGKETYSTNKQSDLDTRIRKPWAIGAGASFKIKKNKIHLSGEWYSKVPYYILLEAQTHYSQSDGTPIDFTLHDNLNSTINFGLGLELFLKQEMSFYASISTDRSVVPENPVAFSQRSENASNSVFTADYYHTGAGFILNLQSVALTLGTTYTGGKQKIARPINLPEDPDDEIFDPETFGELKWSRWRLVFSFSVPFLKDRLNKLEKSLGDKESQ